MDSSPAINAGQLIQLLEQPKEVYRVCGDLPKSLPRLVSRMVALLRTGRTLPEVCREAEIPLTKGRAVVGRLTRAGLVAPVDPIDAFFEEPFDEVEQAFFESDVDPIDECDLPFPKLGDRMRSLFGRLTKR